MKLVKHYKEPLFNKMKRLARKLLLSKATQMQRLAKLAGTVFDYTTEFFKEEIQVFVTGQLLCFQDTETLEVCATLLIEPLGEQSVIVCDEDTDVAGIGRALKKLLEQEGQHVSYYNKPIRYRNGMLAIGPNAIALTNKVVEEKTVTNKPSYLN